MIPKSFVITLPETPERTDAAKRHFAEVGMDAVVFNGIHAAGFGLQTQFPYEVDAPGSGFNIGQKYVGVWLSHYMLWSALNLMDGSHFHIMEVDAKLASDWRPRFESALQSVPGDFDLLFTGSCCCAGHDISRVAGDVFRFNRPTGPQCLHSYIVAKKALPVMLETQRKLYAPIDCSLVFHTFSKLKVYVVLPRIVSQFNTEIPE